jgi:hypothetical protein
MGGRCGIQPACQKMQAQWVAMKPAYILAVAMTAILAMRLLWP